MDMLLGAEEYTAIGATPFRVSPEFRACSQGLGHGDPRCVESMLIRKKAVNI